MEGALQKRGREKENDYKFAFDVLKKEGIKREITPAIKANKSQNDDFISYVLEVVSNLKKENVEKDKEISALKKEINSLSTCPTTGAKHRSLYENKLNNLSCSNSYKQILFDVDKLKHVNDHYGHEAGDKYLKSFVDLLKNEVRKEDAIYRYGGDEFVLVLDNPHSVEEKESFHKILRRINKKIKSTELIFGTEKVNLSASVGIGKTLKEADRKMYQNKKTKKLVRRKKMNNIYKLITKEGMYKNEQKMFGS